MRKLARAYAIDPCALHRVCPSRAARTFTPSQEPKNPRSCSGRHSKPPRPVRAASHVVGYARPALHPTHSSSSTHASHIARAAHVHRSVRVRRVLHRIRSAAQTRLLTPARAPRVCSSKTLQSGRPVLRSSRWRCFYMLGSFRGGQGRKSGVARREDHPCLWAASSIAPSGSHSPLLFARRPPEPILFRKFALQTFRIIQGSVVRGVVASRGARRRKIIASIKSYTYICM